MPPGADARSTLSHQPCHRATGKQDQDGPRTLRGTPSKIELWAGTQGWGPTCADDSSPVTTAATAQARIDVENDCEPGTDSQPITIKGFSYQISAAKALINETADLWFHSLIMLAHLGLGPDQVLAELEQRFGLSGHDEKAARSERGD